MQKPTATAITQTICTYKLLSYIPLSKLKTPCNNGSDSNTFINKWKIMNDPVWEDETRWAQQNCYRSQGVVSRATTAQDTVQEARGEQG